MIADSLDSFVEGRARRKLCIFEEKTFARLHQHILFNQKLTLPDLMAAYSSRIAGIVNRNKKYVIHLAVNDSISHGTNVY